MNKLLLTALLLCALSPTLAATDFNSPVAKLRVWLVNVKGLTEPLYGGEMSQISWCMNHHFRKAPGIRGDVVSELEGKLIAANRAAAKRSKAAFDSALAGTDDPSAGGMRFRANADTKALIRKLNTEEQDIQDTLLEAYKAVLKPFEPRFAEMKASKLFDDASAELLSIRAQYGNRVMKEIFRVTDS